MSAPKQTRHVTIVGGSGNVGAPAVAALIATGHNVTVLSRPESIATFPSSVTVHKGSYDDEAFLEGVLKGQDVLIVALQYTAYQAQIPLFKAAAKAGVPYIVPCEFGSDATNEQLNSRMTLMTMKKPYRELIEELGVSSWIGVVCNPWFDYSMRQGFFGLDVKTKTARIFHDGQRKANFTTLQRVGESLAALLALPEAELAQYKNNWVYFSSFCVSQRDLLESAKRVTGTKEEEWTVISQEPEDVIKTAQEEAARGNPIAGVQVLFALMFSEGYSGNYSEKVVDYKRFGLEPEDLDEVLKNSVA